MRNAGLDSIRFLAFLLVLGTHSLRTPEANEFAKTLWRGGGVGVDIFFVLSGFLVSSVLFREHQRTGGINFKSFLIRRAAKIYPAFYFSLLIYLGLAFTTGQPLQWHKILGELFFLQNYLGNISLITWSLAVEEHFYILLALVFFLFVRFDKYKEADFVVGLFIVVFVTCTFFRFISPRDPEFSLHVATHCRLDGLMFGVLLAYLVAYRDLDRKLSRIHSAWFILIGSTLLAYCFLPVVHDALCYTMSSIGAVFLIIGSRRFKECSPISNLACATYSMYLYHIIVNFSLLKLTTISYNLYLGTYLVLSIACGYLMYRLIERPIYEKATGRRRAAVTPVPVSP